MISLVKNILKNKGDGKKWTILPLVNKHRINKLTFNSEQQGSKKGHRCES